MGETCDGYGFQNCDLEAANFNNFTMKSVDIRGAKMPIQLEGTDLSGAQWDDSTTWSTSFGQSQCNAKTKLPGEIKLPNGKRRSLHCESGSITKY